MQTIWKFPVQPTMHLTLPRQASVLTIALQRGEPHLWVLLDPAAPTIQRTFATYGTGHELPQALTQEHYCGSFLIAEDRLVFHVFETTALPAET